MPDMRMPSPGDEEVPNEIDMASHCITCATVDPLDIELEDTCPQAKRVCGHHCNHYWSHDHCHWCGGHLEISGYGELLVWVPGLSSVDSQGPRGYPKADQLDGTGATRVNGADVTGSSETGVPWAELARAKLYLILR